MTGAAIAGEDAFEAHRDLLFGVAYRMLGSASEAEDILQEAWLRWQGAARDEVRSARSYLVTIVTRLCLDELRSARARREQYIGEWLPEPVATVTAGSDDPEAETMQAESISLAFLAVLERLSPMERAVFLLHDVFDYSHAEVAAIVGRSEAACRQSLHRARARVREGRPRFRASAAERRRMLERFLQAAKGEMDGLVELLAEDVAVRSDGGGKVPAARHPIVGRERVHRFLARRMLAYWQARATITEVNGEPALVLRDRAGEITDVVALEVVDGLVTAIFVIRNPEKLGQLGERRPLA